MLGPNRLREELSLRQLVQQAQLAGLESQITRFEDEQRPEAARLVDDAEQMATVIAATEILIDHLVKLVDKTAGETYLVSIPQRDT